MAFEPSGPSEVGLAVGMLSAIGLDNEAERDARKIDNEWADRMLSAKFPTSHTSIPQDRPQTPLGVGQRSAQVTCRNAHRIRIACIMRRPHPPGCAGPLPLPQAGPLQIQAKRDSLG